MFEGLKDYILEKQIRGLLKQYYAQFGLTLEEATRLPMRELLSRLTEFLADNKNQNNYYSNVVSNLEDRVSYLTIQNQEYKQRMLEMKAENKALHGELAKVRENNYSLKLENTLYKQRFDSNSLTKTHNKEAKFEFSNSKA